MSDVGEAMQKAAAAASEAYRETTEYEAEYRRFVAMSEIPVTEEMIAAAREAGVYGNGSVADVYRAMAAIAPREPNWKDEHNNLLEIAIDQANQVNALLSENTTLKAALDLVRGRAHQPVEFIFSDSIRAALGFSGELRGTIEQGGATVTFGDSTPADLPDPPRRPDGTLQPQAKPLPSGALTQQAGGKRLGG